MNGHGFTFLEIDEGKLINVEEIAAIEDMDPGPPYHHSRVLRARVVLRCGTSMNTRKSYTEIRDQIRNLIGGG